MTTLMRDHIRQLLQKNLRQDRRGPSEYRTPLTVTYGVSSKSAEGSAHVLLGETEIVAGVKLEVAEPYPDTPDVGALSVNVELLPLSNPSFESGPPGIDAIELARVIDRGIRESHMIDVEKLCIKKGEKVWMVLVDIYPLNDAGNLQDAMFLAAVAALRDAKFPTYDVKEGKVSYDQRTTKSLPLTNFPIEVTLIKLDAHYLVDPTPEEWACLEARLTVSTTEDGRICAMQKGGDGALSLADIDAMVKIALEKGKALRKVF